MSADAQPRKRKDKKKKKDERSDSFSGEGKPPGSPPIATMAGPQFTSSTSSPSSDEVMHIYKEGIIGGNMCTKVLFFVIMSALAATISVVILQHRGTASLDRGDESSVSADSGWSLDLGLGDLLSPFSFEEGGEAHDERAEHGEEEHEHGDEHDEHEEEHDHHDEADDNGFMSWLGWGGGSSGEHVDGGEHDHEDEHEHEGETEDGGTGFGSWFGWGGGEDAGVEEATEAPESSSSWFGWGGGETTDDTHPEEGADEHDTDEEDADEDNKDDDEPASEEIVTRHRPSIKYEEEDDDEDERMKNKDDLDQDDDDDDEEDVDKDDDDDDTDKVDETGHDDEDEDDDRGDIDELEDDEDDELTTFLRSLDLEPPPRREEIRPSRQYRRVDVPDRRPPPPKRYEDIDHRESIYTPPPVAKKQVVQNPIDDDDELEPYFKEELITKKKKPIIENEEDEEEMFPEAVEALKLERKSQSAKTKDVKEEVEESRDEVVEEAPFSRDEEPESEDEAQGVAEDEKKTVEKEVEDKAPIPVLVEDTPPPPPVKEADPVKEKVYESKVRDVSGSAALKASEFLAERAAERAAKEETFKQIPPVSYEKPLPVVPKQQPHISIPPPPSLTPDPSDEEQDEEEPSDQENLEYSEGEGVDEEEVVEEEDLDLGIDESPIPSDDGDIQDLGLEGSEPEVDEEEIEEEEEEEESGSEPEALPPPPPTAHKKDIPSSTPDSRRSASSPTSRQDYTRRAGPQSYEEDDITNDYDWAIKEELDMADEEFHRNPSGCLHKYQALQAKYEESPRVRVGLAKCLDLMAKEANSNKLLEFAIYAYRRALKLPMKNKLFLETAETLIKRLRFRGFLDQTIEVHHLIVNRFENEVKHRNDLAVSYLMLNNLKEAEKVLNETLLIWPTDAVARAHYGLTLKLQGRHEESIAHLESGLELDEEATKDARFYFHVGDALVRTGRPSRALKIYEKAVGLGLFRSVYQRSLYNVDRLEAKPWWTLEETTYSTFFRKLEANWRTIRNEGLKAIEYKKGFLDESESLRDKGDWKQFELYARGMRNNANCEIAPVTCRFISEFDAARGCRRGQVKFSLMEGGTHVWPHCGPTNCRLRAHLGLVIPPGPQITVANNSRTWIEGKIIVFDDSFEHEVWHRGTQPRLILIVDVWHPELSQQERRTLSPI